MHERALPLTVVSLHQSGREPFISQLKVHLGGEAEFENDAYFARNYSPANSHLETNLFHSLRLDRYRTGDFYMILCEELFAACGGWYVYDKVIIAMSRAYIARSFRGQPVLARVVMPAIIARSQELGIPVWMSFNESRRDVYRGFERVQAGRPPLLGQEWPMEYRLFKPIGKKRLFGYDQYVVEYRPEASVKK